MQYSALRILVVDDTQSYVSTFTEILANESHEIIAAADGLTGWDRFTCEEPDLALIDVNMPGMNGLELTAKIKSVTSKSDYSGRWVPVLLMSANASVATQLEGYRVGCDDFLNKPLDPDILLAKIAVYQRIIRHICPT